MIFLLLLASLSPFAGADETLEQALNEPSHLEARYACGLASVLSDELGQLPDTDLEQALVSAKASLSGSEQTSETRQLLREIRHYESLKEKRGFFTSALQRLCFTSISLGSEGFQGIAIGASYTTSFFTAPFRWVGKFIYGVFSRDLSPERKGGLAPLLVPNIPATSWLGVLYLGVRTAARVGNPWIFGIDGAATLDSTIARYCQNEPNRKLCVNYSRLKKNEFEFSEKGEQLGVKLGNELLKTFDFKPDGVLNAGLCEWKPSRQISIARRARDRLKLKLNEAGQDKLNVSIIPPIGPGCIYLEISAPPGTDLPKGGLPDFIDGIAVQARATPTLGGIDGERETLYNSLSLCEKVRAQQYQTALIQPAVDQAAIDILQSRIDPRSATKLSAERVPVPSSLQTSLSPSEITKGRNVILVLKPTDEQFLESRELEERYESLKEQFKDEDKKRKKLLRTSSIEECRSLQTKINFDLDHLVQLSKQIDQMRSVIAVRDFATIEKEVKASGKAMMIFKNLKLNWEVEYFSDVEDYRKYVLDPTVRNLAVIAHSFASSKFVDSYLSLLPWGAFDVLSPNLLSLSFYFCNQSVLEKSYHLKKSFSANRSAFSYRILGSATMKSFYQTTDTAPVSAISEFIEDLDHELSTATREQEYRAIAKSAQVVTPAPGAAECKLHIGSIFSSLGSYTIRTGCDQVGWVGTVRFPESKLPRDMTFPCDWIKACESPQILISREDLKAGISRSLMKASQIELTVTGPNGKLVRPKGSYLYYEKIDDAIPKKADQVPVGTETWSYKGFFKNPLIETTQGGQQSH